MLRTRSFLPSVLAAALCAGGVVTFLDRSAVAQEAHAGHDHGEPGPHDPLEDLMNGLKDHLRKLASSIGDPASNAETLGHLSAMESIALEAKPLDPANLDTVPADRRDAHRADYRRDMATLLRDLADMEILVLDGKNAEARERIKSQLVVLRDEAHDKFQKR